MEGQTMATAEALESSQRIVSNRGRGRTWTPEEDKTLLWLVDQVRETPEGGNVTSALEEAADALGRSPVAVRARYYRLASSTENAEIARVRKHKKGKSRTADDFLSHLAGFLGEARRIPDLDLDAFIKGLHCLTSVAVRAKEVPSFKEEVGTLKKNCAELEAKVKDYHERMEKMKEQYETLDYLVREFINLSSVEKVTSLGDFGKRLKYQVDQFGNVMSVERV